MLWLVLVEDEGLRGIYLGGLLAAPVPLFVSWWLVRRTLALDFSRPELRADARVRAAAAAGRSRGWVMQFADRFFILHYADAAEVGLYGVAVRLTNVLMLGGDRVRHSPGRRSSSNCTAATSSAERAVRARAFAAVGVGLGFGAVCLGVWSREFFRTVTDPAFEDAYKSVGLLLGAVVALGLNGVTMTGISITRKTMYFARYAGYATALNIALNFLLIPPFGMVGAAGASFATAAALAALYYWRAQLLDAASFDLRAVLGALALAGRADRDRELDQPRERLAERARQAAARPALPARRVAARLVPTLGAALPAACTGMSVSVLHLGNVAQNGYNNAKLLRRLGVETYAVCDEAQALAQPEWEDAPLPPEIDAMATWPPGLAVDGLDAPGLGDRAADVPLAGRPAGTESQYAIALAAARCRGSSASIARCATTSSRCATRSAPI